MGVEVLESAVALAKFGIGLWINEEDGCRISLPRLVTNRATVREEAARMVRLSVMTLPFPIPRRNMDEEDVIACVALARTTSLMADNPCARVASTTAPVIMLWGSALRRSSRPRESCSRIVAAGRCKLMAISDEERP